VSTTNELEATGDGYSVEKLLAMRLRTREAVDDIAARIGPGMVEEEARAMARTLLAERGMRRGWHHILVRFGTNTTKDFMEASDRGVVLGADDIFFVDIGPIHDGTEGDAGDTFVVGADPDHLRARSDVRAIWADVRDVWCKERLTGRRLYDHAAATASERGWKLNLDLSGHRLSDYPHSAHYAGPLAEVDIVPSPDLWVLEIAIVHPERPFGAFYEDLLLADQRF
jgi:methionyl aminopeptidase